MNYSQKPKSASKQTLAGNLCSAENQTSYLKIAINQLITLKIPLGSLDELKKFGHFQQLKLILAMAAANSAAGILNATRQRDDVNKFCDEIETSCESLQNC